MEEKTKNELYRILGLLDIQIEMIEAWLSGKQVLAPRRCGVTTAKQAKELLDFIEQELDRAREEGRQEQAKLDRELYGMSFEEIKKKYPEEVI